ncbi:MAG: hypothetical protein QM778_19755 [Myxococcales bacterium]
MSAPSRYPASPARPSRWAAALFLRLVLADSAACGGEQAEAGGPGPVDAGTRDAGPDASASQALLIDHKSWQRYDRSEDPLASEQPVEIDCGIAGFYVERGEFEVDTTRCNYLLVFHPSLRGVRAGQRVQLELRHFDLEAAEPAEAHVAILFRDQLQWEIKIPIPQAAETIDTEFTATTDLAPGDPIRLHLHNHGQNMYTFAWLRAVD